MRRPNILLVHSDQHRYDCVGAHGHPLSPTPNLDRLAAQGVSFSHAFTPCPVCVPARNSFLYGTWATRHGAVSNRHTEAPWPPAPELPTWSEALRDAGYRLAYVGKWGIHGRPQDFGFESYVPTSDYYTWRAEAGLPPVPRTGWFGGTDPHISPEQSRIAWEADRVLERMRDLSRGPEPFLIRWDPAGPHLPNIVPEPYASMYPPATIAPWLSFPDPLAGKPYIQAQQRRTWGLDGWTWDDWAPVVARYLGEITLMDAQIGRVLAELERLGLSEDTLVIYTCDHGDLCGGHGMIDKHHVMYDDVVRVPLIMRLPRDSRAGSPDPVAGRTCDAFVSHALDLAVTLCEVAQVPVPETFQGRSLLPLLEGQGEGEREDIFATYHGSQFGLYSSRMVRDRRWKYVWNATAEDELYELERDPGEIVNLAGDASSRQVLERLRHRLLTWMEETEDILLNEWTRRQLLEGLTH